MTALHYKFDNMQETSSPSTQPISVATMKAQAVNKSLMEKDVEINALVAHNKILDNQMAQMATRLAGRTQGQLPSQPESKENANDITLCSGYGYDGPSMYVNNDFGVCASDPVEKVAEKVVPNKVVVEKVAHEKEVVSEFHCMVTEGVVLGHLISEKGIEVDQAKFQVIKQVSPPVNVKGIRSFLGHAGIKQALIFAPIIRSLYWDLPFEIMCDATDYAVGVILGQRKEKVLHAIYYASKTLEKAQLTMLLLRKIFFLWSMPWTSSVHISLGPRLRYDDGKDATPIDDSFPDDHLLAVANQSSWFADYANYIVGVTLPDDLSYQQKKRFLHDIHYYFWDDPYLFCMTADGLYKRCIPE
ncbi:uncharacterized protein [Spinacia oleracea]|uniref:Reverse transcriptase/retrotransposon-derived protein RNase H-like domain-containing protein n=1 Tax=Spinacia oleracea TaxID=3562 RepID=A0ABM3RJE9_SPIOL|nr:uncharacterized protein LOC110792697 [Spinacia oleracea]